MIKVENTSPQLINQVAEERFLERLEMRFKGDPPDRVTEPLRKRYWNDEEWHGPARNNYPVQSAAPCWRGVAVQTAAVPRLKQGVMSKFGRFNIWGDAPQPGGFMREVMRDEVGNILSGPGAKRQHELGGRHRRNGRTYNTIVRRESRSAPLGLSETISHGDLIEGDIISTRDGKVVPLAVGLPFSGIIEGVSEASSGYSASLSVRGALSAVVDGLDHRALPGVSVYVKPGARTQTLTLSSEGAVLIGAILAIEDPGLKRAIVGFKLADDPQSFQVDRR